METRSKELLDFILNDVHDKWKDMLKLILNSDEGIKVLNLIAKKLDKHKNNNYIFPFKENIFSAFKYFDLHDTKLVLLGQDPYINGEYINNIFTPQAMGLSFSVPENVRVPPSLRNIYKEIKNCYNEFQIPNHGNLTRWVKEEKILLLNSALTVKNGVSNSHQKYWTPITDKVIKYISDNCDKVVFLLLGNNAKGKSKLIDESKHYIVTGVHPSPLSANRGFFGSLVFKKINDILKSNNLEEINWNI